MSTHFSGQIPGMTQPIPGVFPGMFPFGGTQVFGSILWWYFFLIFYPLVCWYVGSSDLNESEVSPLACYIVIIYFGDQSVWRSPWNASTSHDSTGDSASYCSMTFTYQDVLSCSHPWYSLNETLQKLFNPLFSGVVAFCEGAPTVV